MIRRVAFLTLLIASATGSRAVAQVRCSANQYATCIAAVTTVTAKVNGGPPIAVTIEPAHTPLGSRMPLLLIHGWNKDDAPGEPYYNTFDNLLGYLKLTDPDFFLRFKPYRVEWWSNRANTPLSQIAAELRDVLDQYNKQDGEFGAAQIAVVAHSTAEAGNHVSSLRAAAAIDAE